MASKARAVLDALLDKYADEGIGTIESAKVLQLQTVQRRLAPRWKSSTTSLAARISYEHAIQELEHAIYV